MTNRLHAMIEVIVIEYQVIEPIKYEGLNISKKKEEEINT